MKLKPFLYMLVVFAFFVSACGADTGGEDTTDFDNTNGPVSTEGAFTPGVDVPAETSAGPSTQGAGSGGGTAAVGSGTDMPGTAEATQGVEVTQGAETSPQATQPAATPAAQTSPQATTGADTGMATATASAGLQTTPAAGSGGVLPNTGLPAQSERAEIRGQREQLVVLSNLIGYQLVSADGQAIGTVSDYVINTCETFIVYMVVEPAASVGAQAGSILVPYELVTINSGAVDAEARSIVINMTPEQFSQAPAFEAGMALTPNQWEGQVRGFYEQHARVSNLSTECRVEGGPIYKVAYASQLMQAELRDGNGQPLGMVREAILEPESGSLDFFVVELYGQGQGQGAQTPEGNQQGNPGVRAGQNRLVLVPLAAVNIPNEAMAPGGQLWLVLLTDTGLLMQAPQLAFIEEAYSFDVQNAARKYWGQPVLEPGAPGSPNLPGMPLPTAGGDDSGQGTPEPVTTEPPAATP